jgi:two-component system, cell cycle response regulator
VSIRILTVDDSKTVRLLVGRAFKKFDCVVLEAPNGADGLAVAARERPDVILLDYTMPVLDGMEMLTRLISDPELKRIPVVMLTAVSGRETLAKMASLGVRDYLVKPFKEDVLMDRIGRIVPLKPKAEATMGAAAVAAAPEVPRKES